ncbi:MAG: 2-oxoisovalerate dehydrogenase [Chloroflexi bacterium RBG_16_57_9]|nr:MAG: 2-oxoisovalerate dehydrogenase [Chloroflexi bacterium RBG_16_57_9]
MTAQPSGLSRDDLVAIYQTMRLVRTLDERLWVLQRQGKTHFVITSRGHEAAEIGSAWALRQVTAYVQPYYRNLALAVGLGVTAREIMLMFRAKAEDPASAGRQMSCHYGHPRLRVYPGSSVVTVQMLHAAGMALASKIKGEDAVSVAYFGEGSTSEGDFHEALNWAGIHRLPVIFFCENNEFAVSTPAHKQMTVSSVAERASAYGIAGLSIDGADVWAVYAATVEAIERARQGKGATLIEARVVRLTGHSSDDDERVYRSAASIEAARQNDPILRFQTELRMQGVLTDELDHEIQAHVTAEVDEATAYAEAAPYPDVSTVLEHVYAKRQT